MKKRVSFHETLKDGPEIEFRFEPIENTILQAKAGDRFVVGYLAQDDYPSNPMKECNGQGTLYTYNEGVITDDNGAASHLGLLDFASRFSEPDYDLDLDEVNDAVFNKVQQAILADEKLKVWAAQVRLELGDTWLQSIVDRYRGEYVYGVEWDEVDDVGFDKLSDILGDSVECAKAAWYELWLQGKIGDRLAIPVRYYDSVHGPCTTQICVCSLDSANAVWVPDQCALDNMTLTGDHAKDYETAKKYAESVLDEYEKWCSGEVFGVIVEVFDEDGKRVSEDSCWGHIGANYAEETLKEEFESACKREAEQYDRDVRTQCGRQVEMVL